MFSHVKTVAFSGIDTIGVDVQSHVPESGQLCFNIVGLPDKSVAESKERVRAAI